MMKFWRGLFIGIFVILVVFNDVKADTSMTDSSVPKTCPPGCFCLRNGKVLMNILETPDYAAACQTPALIGFYTDRSNEYFCGTNVQKLGIYKREEGKIYVEDFSESYVGHFGFYGFKDGEFVYYQRCGQTKEHQPKPGESSYLTDPYDLIFNCPKSYPNSDAGSKSLYDCYTYDQNGNKIHYGENKLKAVDYNGWVPIVNCQPGYYMPANTTECRRCTDNKVACPGGMFYVDKSYAKDRGTIQCENGVESNHTSCKSWSSTNSSSDTKQTYNPNTQKLNLKFDEMELGSVFSAKSAVVPTVNRSVSYTNTPQPTNVNSNNKQSISRSVNAQPQSPRTKSVNVRNISDVKRASRRIGN